MKNFAKKILLLCQSFLVLFTVFSFLGRDLSPVDYWWITIWGLFLPWLLIGHILFIFFWLWKKKWYFLFSCVVIIGGIDYYKAFFNWNINSPKDYKSSTHLLSYNIFRLYQVGKDVSTFKKEFRESISSFPNLDLICLQECSNQNISTFKDISLLSHSFKHPKHGTAILSKYAIIKTGTVDIKSKGNSAIWIEINHVQLGHIRVYNLHLQTNRITKQTQELVNNPDFKDESTYRTIYDIFANYKKASILREEQAETILNHIRNMKKDIPVLIAGDFNETSQSLTYELFNSKYQNGFFEKGGGLGTTYSGIPLLKIDHIFVDNDLTVTNSKVLSDKFSDHYPIVVGVTRR